MRPLPRPAAVGPVRSAWPVPRHRPFRRAPRLGHRPRDGVFPGLAPPGLAGQRLQPREIVIRERLERQGPQQRGTPADQVSGGTAVVFDVAGPVLQVVEHLESRAHVQGIPPDGRGLLRDDSREPDAQGDGGLEGRRGLESVDRRAPRRARGGACPSRQPPRRATRVRPPGRGPAARGRRPGSRRHRAGSPDPRREGPP